MHEGHRSRMIEKLKSSDTLPEHELLEILLFNAIPRKNTNPIAHALLERYNTLSNVFDAEIDDLSEIDGIGESTASYIKVVGMILKRYAPASAEMSKYERDTFPAYLLKRYEGIKYERLDMFILDNSRRIKSIKTFTIASVDSIVIEPKVVTKALIDANAYAVVFSHNHPYADNEPSVMDNRFTKQCQIMCSMNNIRLLDHFIVGNNGVFSYLDSGKLAEINKNYSIDRVLNEGK